MGKILSMEEFRKRNSGDAEYQEVLENVVEALERAADEAGCGAFNLACNGVWREWSDAQPVGAVSSFEDEELASCGDSRVEMLMTIMQTLRGAVEILEKQAN